MKVYRVETVWGKGPYTGPVSHYEWATDSRHQSVYSHPNIQNDGIEMDHRYSKDYHCGFSSIKKMKQWFTKKEMTLLYSLGFKISMYNVSKQDIIEGRSKKQLMFNKKKAAYIKDYIWE